MGTPAPAKTQVAAPAAKAPAAAAGRGLLQRTCACGTHTVAGVECDGCGEARLQRWALNPSEPPGEPPGVRDVLRSPGRPLDPATRSFMEPRFAHEFSGVRARGDAPAAGPLAVVPSSDPSEREADAVARRVTSPTFAAPAGVPAYDFGRVRLHTDAAASASALALNARAYSVGEHIVFAEGQYRPGSSAGRELLAHELAHVARAGAGPSPRLQNSLHRKTFETDEASCTATMTYLMRMLFLNKGDDKWDAKRKAAFRSKFEKTAEDTFNANPYRIKPHGDPLRFVPGSKKEAPCACPDEGFKPELQINVPDEEQHPLLVKPDWVLAVTANLAGEKVRAITKPEFRTTDLEETDVALRDTGPDEESKQVPAVHEVGHILGLHHPGKGISDYEPNEPEEYKHSGEDIEGREVHGPGDLMGKGMGLRPFYFDEWRDEVKKKYGAACRWEIEDPAAKLEKPELPWPPLDELNVAPRWFPRK